MLFGRLFDLRLFGFVCFLFLLESGKDCGLYLWHSLDFSLTVFFFFFFFLFFCFFFFVFFCFCFFARYIKEINLRILFNICTGNKRRLLNLNEQFRIRAKIFAQSYRPYTALS